MALPVAAGLLDAGRVARANAAMARLFQAPPERLEGRSIWDFVAGGGAEELQQRYAARLRGEAVTTRYEMELVRPDGSHFEVESDAQALDGRRTLVIFRTARTCRPQASVSPRGSIH